MFGCVQFTKRDGNLVITLMKEGRQEILDAKEMGRNTDSDNFLIDLLESPLCNGWERILPEQVGALTDSIILSDETERDEDGELVKADTVYWFPNYQIESPVATLFEKGEVVFTGVKE